MTGNGNHPRLVCMVDGCANAAVVCQECVRVLALQWFGAIARHGGHDAVPCQMCEVGDPAYCPEHFLAEVVAYRQYLRELGNPIGERFIFCDQR